MNTLIICTVLFGVCNFNCSNIESSISKGRKIYNEGVLSNGDNLVGTIDGSGSLSGEIVSCARCHRKSGYGSIEGNIFVPPIASEFLFDNYLVERKDMIRSLFQEEYNLQDGAKIRQLEERPSYDFHSLKNLIVDGINSDGVLISPIMPRYQLGEEDLTYLMSYLKTLNSLNPIGISEDTIHFATVITDEVSSEDEAVFVQIISAYAEWKNRNVVAQNKAAEGPEFHRGAFKGTYLNWKIHFWKLEGDTSTWQNQLEGLYQIQPVFSFLSGLSNKTWDPMHTFAERHNIPSVFPNTNLPNQIEDYYNLYFSQGVRQEIKLILSYLESHKHSILVLTDDSSISESIIDEFDASLEGHGGYYSASVDHFFMEGEFERFSRVMEIDSLIIFLALAETSIPELCELRMEDNKSWTWIMHSDLIYKTENCFSKLKHLYTTPYRLDPKETPRNHRIHAWMRSRGIQVTDETLQLNTFFALSVADFALGHMIDHYSRDYFIEKIEHETENNLNPGFYQNMSLGPGQRFASREVHLVKKTGEDISIIL